MSADTVPPLFPGRPIRPLPKRRLRERLSPDVADAIQYPPAPQTTTPLFYYPYTRDEEPEQAAYGRRESRPGLQGPASTDGQISDGLDDATRMTRIASLAITMSNSVAKPSRAAAAKQDQSKPPEPSSADSAADGYYDPFEITNNKKKRKIPTAGDGMLNGSHGLHDNLSGPESPGTPMPSIEGHGELSSPAAALSSYYSGPNGFGTSSHNMSGPGRGRYGRVRNGRSPLRTLSDSFHNWAGRNGKLRPPPWGAPSTESRGIISTAIANAGKLPPPSGQENLSLLQQQQQPSKAQPASTQFTFTCESQVPGSVAWPGMDRRHTVALPHLPGPAREDGGRLSAPAAYPSTSLLPVRDLAEASNSQSKITTGQPPDAAATQTATAAAAPPRRFTRREVNAELRQSARARRREQHDRNLRNPEKADAEFWMCEYCEYEAIYGEKPRSLIRHYELKDRKLRREAAEKKRLLEKAKAKSRRGKKNNKAATSKEGGAAAQESAAQQGEVELPARPSPGLGAGQKELEGEDQYGDAVHGEEGHGGYDEHREEHGNDGGNHHHDVGRRNGAESGDVVYDIGVDDKADTTAGGPAHRLPTTETNNPGAHASAASS